MSTVQSYTIDEDNATRPASNSYEIAMADPKLKISGLNGTERVDVWLSFDGSDPTADDRAFQVTRDDAPTGTFIKQLEANIGDKIIFTGRRLTSSSSITVEVQAS